jgi:hypothetical protein
MQSAWIIPALHDAASDRPIRYTPVCVTATVPVCVHPAFKDFLPNVTAGLGPVLRELAGLPGAPVRVAQAPVGSLAMPSGAVIGVGTPQGALGGTPPVFWYTADTLPARSFAQTPLTFSQSLRGALVAAFLPAQITHAAASSGQHGNPPGGTPPGGPGVAARMAVQSALLLVAGVPLNAQSHVLAPSRPWVTLPAARQAQVNAAARRLAALPAAARHDWLASHLAALRAGHLTLAQLP